MVGRVPAIPDGISTHHKVTWCAACGASFGVEAKFRSGRGDFAEIDGTIHSVLILMDPHVWSGSAQVVPW